MECMLSSNLRNRTLTRGEVQFGALRTFGNFGVPISANNTINYPAAELRGIKIQNLFPCRHSCASRNPVYVGPLFSKEQAWIPTFVGMTDEVTLYQATWNYQFKTLKHFVFGEPVFIRPAELGGIQQVSFIK